jgi:hypothetical protein
MSNDYVCVNVRIMDISDHPLVESAWAEPVLATEFGGDYRLLTDLLLTPLCRGDVVRCEVTADGALQVVDIRQIVPGLLIRFEHPKGTDSTVKRILKAVRSLGYQVGRPFDGCASVFVPNAELERDIPFVPLPSSWKRRELYDGPFRMRAVIETVDFTLAAAPLPDEDLLEHLAPDDPQWGRLEPELAVPGA